MYRAVLDACVLVPNLQRDFLLQLATEEAFSPLWGSGILTELDYTLAKLHGITGITDGEERRRHLLAQMKRAFPGSEVNSRCTGYRRIVTTRVVGRQPNGSCANRRVTVSRGAPSQPHRRHHPSGSRTRHARTARPGSSRWPVTSSPSASSRQNVVRSGQVKVASGTSRSSRWQRQNSHHRKASTPTQAPTRRVPLASRDNVTRRLHPQL